MTTEAPDTLSDTVRLHTQDGVVVLTIDNPPVNGLGNTVRAGLFRGLEYAIAEPQVRAVVIAGAGSMFCGGADIRQFNTPAAAELPLSRDVQALIRHANKPVVAAIHGAALGGGLELALACHFRVASAQASLGLPEVQLGLVPGGGGTQRLPRLIGARAALEMIVQGRPVDAAKACALGLVDAVAQGQLLAFATAFALEQAAAEGSLPDLHGRMPALDEVDFAAVRAGLDPRARNHKAQKAAVDCVEMACQHELAHGLDLECEVFLKLVAGPESHALRHLFFAERQAPKFEARIPADTPAIASVAVLGAGTMGGGIAMAFANAGLPVTLVERDQAALDRGLSLVRRNYGVTVEKGKLSPAEVEARLARIRSSLRLEDVAEADLVIEAVFEDMAVKQELFGRLDTLCKPGAILASNTSRLDIDRIASATGRPEDVIGLHFFSPANVMRLLEVVRGERTSDAVIARCMAMAQAIGKIPVLVGVCEGFVGNRMLTGYWREAWFMLEEGARPEQIDAAMKRFGMAMGPLAMADLAGLDINWATRQRLLATWPPGLRYPRVADRICEAGRLGQKTGAGYYRYDNGSRLPQPDPQAMAIIEAAGAEAGFTRRAFTDEEIVERCVLALVNEGARILDDGIARRASDIDVVYVHGYGFPAWRGGPMHYAGTLGLEAVLARLRALEAAHGAQWTPAPLIQRLVADGQAGF
ncbi:3-hydroxyacyl-CoA dehydrogenase NAD-binding domain-containing protein [Aquincola sp. MAHUQ-54]|uniref:3-hydroxyacyl-CoA dehydrogenase NAD-binding domain-containing protein n=2 Tax=Sphaerotilaceae TaxID=2975441 RepID=A0AAW9Q994_9BURK